MADYTIDINLNSSTGKTAQSDPSDRSNGTSKSDSYKETALQRGLKKLNILHSGALIQADESATRFLSKSAAEQQKLAAIGKSTVIGMAVSATIGVGWNAVKTFTLGNIAEKYGDQARQNQVNNILSTAGKGASILGSTAVGAAAGALVGPVGAAVGAAVGFIGSVSNQIITMVEAD
jgi:hypothetical protein